MLGGNIGDVRAAIDRAVETIENTIGRIECQSDDYITEPWGFSSADKFVNRAVVVLTRTRPAEILEHIQRIEREAGRDRAAEARAKAHGGQKYASRTLDVDIIMYGGEIVHGDDLTIPHPMMGDREFVLEPLAQIMPHAIHPVLGRSVSEMLCDLRRRNGD